MTGQVNFKVSGPWRMLIRQDNQDARVVNSNEDFSVILNEGAQTANFSVSMMSTDMPYQPPVGIGAIDETKAFAPDPHEPEKTAEQMNIPLDPTLREKEMREAEARNRLAPGVSGGSVLGSVVQKPYLDMTDEEIEIERKKREDEENEKSRIAGEEEAAKKEAERVAKEDKASTSTTSKKK